MVVITCNLTADIGPMQYLCDVFGSWWDLQKEDRDTDVILLSGSHEARVHRAVLHRISPFLHGLVHQAAPSCLCSTPAITLPEVQGETLAVLVELVYTGRSKVESKKAKEEFAELTELLQVGLDVQYEEISSHERVDPNQVAAEATVASTVVKTAHEKAAADTRRKDEEKVITDKQKKDLEKAAADKRMKDDEKTDADRRKDDEKAAADKRRKDEKKSARLIEQKGKATSLKNKEAGFEKAETEVIAVLDLKTNVENEPAAENEKEGKKTDATKKIKMMEKTESVEFSKLIDEASSVKVGEVRQTRGRGRKSRGSTVPEIETIPFLTSVNQNRRDKSPDSILAKTTRNQKRKIQTILNVHDEIDNIQDIIANNSTDANLFEDDVNENNNDMDQNPIKVNAANDSIEELLENSQMSILSDEGFLLDGSRDGWDKETETNDKEAKFVCPFCEKKFQKKGRYDNHLSWNHFQVEISEKFPGLECPACKRRFVKKSNYVSHLGSFHKVIEGLMAVAFQDKMALIREAQQRKLFASPKHEGGDGVWVETPGIG